VPEETAVAFTFDRKAYAVMMATPANLEDFAYGFSFSERIISSIDDVRELEVVELAQGIELRMSLVDSRNEHLDSRARRFAGPAGCGLCGLESLDQAVAPPRAIASTLCVDSHTVFRAMKKLHAHQPVNAIRTVCMRRASGRWRRTISSRCART